MIGGIDRFAIALAVVFAFLAYKNAVEAHLHTHELGCYVKAQDLCEFHEDHQ